MKSCKSCDFWEKYGESCLDARVNHFRQDGLSCWCPAGVLLVARSNPHRSPGFVLACQRVQAGDLGEENEEL